MKKNTQNEEPSYRAEQVPFERLSAHQQQVVHRKHKKKKSKGFVALLVILIIVGILLVASGAGALYLNKLMNLVDRSGQTGNTNLDDTDLVDPEELVDQPDSTGGIKDAVDSYNVVKDFPVFQDKDIYNILLIGSDTRGNENGRSDAMIILSINKKTHKIHLTSLMRAMYVLIPDKGWGMINASYSWGGSDMLLRTIATNFRLKIDDFMVINFNGFTKAIDQAGGVDITLTAKESEYLNNQMSVSKFSEGVNHLSGEEALNYSRIRHLDSDFKRTGRQRTVIEALIGKSSNMSAISLLGLAETVLPLVKTDLSKTQMLSLMVDLMGVRKYPVSQLMLPLEEDREMIYVHKMEMYKFDFEKTIKTLHDFLNE